MTPLSTKPVIVKAMQPRAPSSITRRLERFRNEARLDAHLAWMEARDRWREIEPRLFQAERLAAHVTEISFRALGQIASEVKRFQDQRAQRRPQG